MPIPSRRRLAVVCLLLLLLGGGYFAATALVRRHVDRRLEAAHGHVLDFALPDASGRSWTAHELRGRTVVLSFFRSRCSGCLAERDAIRALAERLDPAHAILLSICMDHVEEFPADVTAATLAQMDYRHPVLFADARFVDAFHGSGWAHVTPITWVATPDGQVTTHLRGHQSLDALLAALPADALRRSE